MNYLDGLEPDFADLVRKLIEMANEKTSRIWIVTSGHRTMAEQAKIYAQGRTEPGKVVSNARPGSSAHNFGLAADLAPMNTNGKDIDWSAPKPLWREMADIAVSLGLTAGFYFSTIFDAPHVEHPRWKAQQALWRAGKLEVP